MCLLNKTPEYIVLFLLILSRNIFGIYGSSGPPANSIKEFMTTGGSGGGGAIGAGGSVVNASPSTITPTTDTQIADEDWLDILILIFKASIMISIIVAAVFGNLLVIISVMRNRKLR